MTPDEVKEIIQWIHDTPTPHDTLIGNIRFLEHQNRKSHLLLKKAEEVLAFYSNVPRASFARECDGGLRALELLEVLKSRGASHERNNESPV
jgi:hypothetical protein